MRPTTVGNCSDRFTFVHLCPHFWKIFAGTAREREFLVSSLMFRAENRNGNDQFERLFALIPAFSPKEKEGSPMRVVVLCALNWLQRFWSAPLA
jgi:hypothetical protein